MLQLQVALTAAALQGRPLATGLADDLLGRGAIGEGEAVVAGVPGRGPEDLSTCSTAQVHQGCHAKAKWMRNPKPHLFYSNLTTYFVLYILIEIFAG